MSINPKTSPELLRPRYLRATILTSLVSAGIYCFLGLLLILAMGGDTPIPRSSLEGFGLLFSIWALATAFMSILFAAIAWRLAQKKSFAERRFCGLVFLSILVIILATTAILAMSSLGFSAVVASPLMGPMVIVFIWPFSPLWFKFASHRITTHSSGRATPAA